MRKPWLAVILSLLCPGLGHLYCGFLWRGLLLLILPFGVLAGFALLSTAAPSMLLLGLLVGFVLVLPLIYLVAVLDSYRLARAAPSDYRAKPWQRPLVYGVVVVLSFLSVPLTTFLLRADVVEAFVIPAASMAPTIVPGDRVLVTKWRWTGADAKKGDIVVFHVWRDGRHVHYIKRVAALPGDVVSMPSGVSEKIPEGHLWVLGDNTELSLDSRKFGPVPMRDMVGPVRYRYWPPRRFGTFE